MNGPRYAHGTSRVPGSWVPAADEASGLTYQPQQGGYAGLMRHMRGQPTGATGSLITLTEPDSAARPMIVYRARDTGLVDVLDAATGGFSDLPPNPERVWFAQYPYPSGQGASGEPAPGVAATARALGISPRRFARFLSLGLDLSPHDVFEFAAAMGDSDGRRLLAQMMVLTWAPGELLAVAAEIGLPSPVPLYRVAVTTGETPRRLRVLGEQLLRVVREYQRPEEPAGEQLVAGLVRELYDCGVHWPGALHWVLELADRWGWGPRELDVLREFARRGVPLELVHDLPPEHLAGVLARMRAAERARDDDELATVAGLGDGDVLREVAALLNVAEPKELVALRPDFDEVMGRLGPLAGGAKDTAGRVVAELRQAALARGVKFEDYLQRSLRLGFPETELQTMAAQSPHFQRLYAHFRDERPGRHLDADAIRYGAILRGWLQSERRILAGSHSPRAALRTTLRSGAPPVIIGPRPGMTMLLEARREARPPAAGENRGAEHGTGDGAAAKLGISEAEFQRLSGQVWFAPQEILALAEDLQLPPRDVVSAGEALGRLPSDVATYAAQLGGVEPRDLLTVAKTTTIDYRHFGWLRDFFGYLADGTLTVPDTVAAITNLAEEFTPDPDSQWAGGPSAWPQWYFWLLSRVRMESSQEYRQESQWWLGCELQQAFGLAPGAAEHLYDEPWWDFRRFQALMDQLALPEDGANDLRSVIGKLGHFPDDLPDVVRLLAVYSLPVVRVLAGLGRRGLVVEPRVLPHFLPPHVQRAFAAPSVDERILEAGVKSVEARLDLLAEVLGPHWTRQDMIDFVADRMSPEQSLADFDWLTEAGRQWRSTTLLGLSPDNRVISAETFRHRPEDGEHLLRTSYSALPSVNWASDAHQRNGASAAIQGHHTITAVRRTVSPVSPASGPVQTRLVEDRFTFTYDLMPDGLAGVERYLRMPGSARRGLVVAQGSPTGGPIAVELDRGTGGLRYFDGAARPGGPLQQSPGQVWFLPHRDSTVEPSDADTTGALQEHRIGMRMGRFGYRSDSPARGWERPDHAAVGSLAWEDAHGNRLELGRVIPDDVPEDGHEHAEDILLRTVAGNLALFSPDEDNHLILTLSTSPCTSHTAGGLSATSAKNVGCTERLIELVTNGIDGYRFRLTLQYRDLYAPRLRVVYPGDFSMNVPQTDVIAASLAAIQRMRDTGRIDVHNDGPDDRLQAAPAQPHPAQTPEPVQTFEPVQTLEPVVPQEEASWGWGAPAADGAAGPNGPATWETPAAGWETPAAGWEIPAAEWETPAAGWETQAGAWETQAGGWESQSGEAEAVQTGEQQPQPGGWEAPQAADWETGGFGWGAGDEDDAGWGMPASPPQRPGS